MNEQQLDEQRMDEEEKFIFETWEDWAKQGYDELSVFSKIYWQLQTHLFSTMIVTFIGGYLAGIYFGIFW